MWENGEKSALGHQYFDQLRRNSYRLSYRDRSCSALFYGKQTIEKIERRDAEGQIFCSYGILFLYVSGISQDRVVYPRTNRRSFGNNLISFKKVVDSLWRM